MRRRLHHYASSRWQGLRLPLCLLAVALSGCGGPQVDTGAQRQSMPTDFWLEIYVQGQPEAHNPLDQTGRVVVEVDRRLRAVQGDEVAARVYPPAVRTLSPREIESLVNVIRRHRLMSEPTSPLAEEAIGDRESDVTIYHVAITAWGRTNRYATTPEESPPSAALLSELLTLARRPAPGPPEAAPIEELP